MNNPLRNIGFAVLSVGALMSTASAANAGYQGVLCNPSTFSDASRLGYSQWGVHNSSPTTAAAVNCGGLPTIASDVFNFSATVYDRNSTADLCCTFLVHNANGTVISSATRCSAGNSPAEQLLSWVPPFIAARASRASLS